MSGPASIQDVPPRGGFGIVDVRRNLPKRGFSGLVLLGGGALISLVGVKLACDARRERMEWEKEEKKVRFFLAPLLQAERDEYVLENKPEFKRNVYRTRTFIPQPLQEI